MVNHVDEVPLMANVWRWEDLKTESVSVKSERVAVELALTDALECYTYCGVSGDKEKTSVSRLC